MQFSNQQSGTITSQARFTPVSRTISNIGTTVSYSLNAGSVVNAIDARNLNSMTSGQFSNFVQPNWNGNYSQLNPVVSASQFSQNTSGNYMTPQTLYTSGNYITPQTYYVRSLFVQPGIDISETSSDVVVTAHVSNLAINDLNLNVTDNSVTISGTAWTGRESLVLNRTVALPTSIQAESVDANLQSSGVIEIRCPKSEKLTRHKTTINTDTTQSK